MNRKQLEKLSDSELRAALRTARQGLGLNKSEMAALMGVGSSAYGYKERETRPLKPGHREEIIEMLQGSEVTAPEKGDVRAMRLIDGAMVALTKRERGRVFRYLAEKYGE